jgi:4-amino-4-deoxy-L-arabinose transferase-like glycosyltransferase
MGTAFFFRFYNLSQAPLWYGDECSELMLCQDFSRGMYNCDARQYRTFLPPYTYSPPLYPLMCSRFTAFFGETIHIKRIYTSIFALLCVPLLLILSGMLFKAPAAHLSTLIFALHPIAVVYNRYGFRHNQSMFFNLLFFLLAAIAIKSSEKTYLMAGFLGLAGGMSLFSSYRSYFIFFIFLYVFLKYFDLKKLLLGLFLFFLPGLIMYIPLIMRDNAAFFSNFYMDALNIIKGPEFFNAVPLLDKFSTMCSDFLDLFSIDFICFFSFVGFFVHSKNSIVKFIFTSMILFVITIVHKQEMIRTFTYPALLIMPLFSLGASLFCVFVYKGLINRYNCSNIKKLNFLSILFFTVYLVFLSNQSLKIITGKSPTSLVNFSVQSNKDTAAAASYLNRNTDKSDIVIANPNLLWLLNCRRTSILQAVGYEAKKFPPYFLWPMPVERFVFDPSFKEAAYFVFARGIDTIFTFNIAGVADYVNQKINSGNWKLVKQIGEYNIYRNTKKQNHRKY